MKAGRILLAILATASFGIAVAYNPAALGPRWDVLSSAQEQSAGQVRDGYSPQAEADRVKELPGIADNQLDFGLFGGCALNVSRVAGLYWITGYAFMSQYLVFTSSVVISCTYA